MSGGLDALLAELRRARQVVVMGVGSELRGDDASGLLVTSLLQSYPAPERCVVIAAGPAPEGSLGAVRAASPSHVVIVDAADMGAPAGCVRVLPLEAISDLRLSTHSFSLGMLAHYMTAEFGCHVAVVGIQPASVKMGAPVTGTVRRAAERLATALAGATRGPGLSESG